MDIPPTRHDHSRQCAPFADRPKHTTYISVCAHGGECPMVDRCGGYHRQVCDVAEFGACRPDLRPYLLRICSARSHMQHPICTHDAPRQSQGRTVYVPRQPQVSTTADPTMPRVSPKVAPHMSQGCPKEAPRLPPQCPVSVPRSHRICPKRIALRAVARCGFMGGYMGARDGRFPMGRCVRPV